MKRYALAAAVVVFLLVWISQQNAADNTVRYTLAVDQQSTAYDRAKRLDRDDQPLVHFQQTQRYRRLPSHRSEYRIVSANTTTSSSSVDSGIRPDTGEGSALMREMRSRNSSVGDLKKDFRRSPVTNNETEFDSQRHVDLLRHSSVIDGVKRELLSLIHI